MQPSTMSLQHKEPTWWNTLNSKMSDYSVQSISSPLRYPTSGHQSKSHTSLDMHCEPNVYKCRQASTSSVLAARLLSRQHMRILALMERNHSMSLDNLQAVNAGSKSSRLTIKHLRPYFEQPIVLVAEQFGISVTLLKKRCRQLGIARWPHRQITGLRKSIESLDHAAAHLQEEQRATYQKQLDKLKWKLLLLLHDPRGKEDRLDRDIWINGCKAQNSVNPVETHVEAIDRQQATMLPRLNCMKSMNALPKKNQDSSSCIPPLNSQKYTIEATQKMLPSINLLLNRKHD